MKKVFLFVILVYAFFIKFIDIFFTCLSLSIKTNIDLLLCEKIIPDIVSIFSIGYCTYNLWKRHKKTFHEVS